jgi:hypothetical protein
VLVFAMAYSSCALNLSRRFRAFSFTDFSGEYAFYFSTGMGTEPVKKEISTHFHSTHNFILFYASVTLYILQVLTPSIKPGKDIQS